jgi:hypothetical protein
MKLARHCLRFITEQKGAMPGVSWNDAGFGNVFKGLLREKSSIDRRNDKSPDCDSQGF